VVDIDSQAKNQVVDASDTPETDNDNFEVCLIAPQNPQIALVLYPEIDRVDLGR